MDTDLEIISAGPKAIRASLDLNSMPPVDISIDSEDYLTLYPVSAYRDDNNLPIEFISQRSQQFYSSPVDSFLYVKCKITKADGKPTLATDIVAPSQMFALTMIDAVYVYVNGIQINHSPNNYCYRAAVDQLISTTIDYQDSVLSPELFYRDKIANEFDIEKNEGFKRRFELSKESKSFEMAFPLAENLFEQIRCLPPQCEIRVKIMRSRPEACLVGKKLSSGMSPFPYAIQWESCILYMKRLQVDPSVVKYHESILKENGRLNYPVFNTSVRYFSIPKEATSFSEIISLGKIGNRILVFMTAADAHNGSIEKVKIFSHMFLTNFNLIFLQDKLTFEDFGISSVELSVDGVSKFFKKVEFGTTKDYLLAYKMLLDARPNKNQPLCIDRSQFGQGNFILAFQLTPLNQGGGYSRVLAGQLKLNLTFHTALTSPISLFVLGKYQSLFQLDENFNTYTDNTII
jgi:hypothetical protein